MSALKQDINHLFNQARAKIPGSSDAGLKAELFDVLREFFTGSTAWQESIPLNILVDTTDYNIVPTDGGTIIGLVNVFDGLNIPQPAILADYSTIRFQHAYNSQQSMTAVVIKSVVLPVGKSGIPEFPDWVLPIFGDWILEGIMGRMMSQDNKPYTNEQMGVYHLKRFNRGIAKARVSVLRNRSQGTQAWVYPQQYSAGTQKGGSSEFRF